MKFSDFKALTFDVYGTLIDWETGMFTALKPLIEKVDHELTRDEVLQRHAYYESTQQFYTPAKRYQELLPIVYRRLAEEWGVEVTLEECEAYGQSVKDWPAFPDSPGALQYLKKHFKLVVLTNTDNDTFQHSQAKLQVEFDGRYTAEDVGSYKPESRNFDYMLDRLSCLGIEKEDILHTAESMFHDHQPANEYGLANCHIYRRHDKKGFGATMTPDMMPSIDFRFNSMADLVKAHQTELES
jgi:2-haloacid dehalogenase